MWVAGTGAFLLFVASAVFIAANWSVIPDAAKLAAVGLLTGSCLVAGRRLRPTLPGTAGALYHLGAFLIPVNVAAVGAHLEARWDVLLLAEGAIGAAAFWWLGRSERSVVLEWASWAAVVVAAGGLGALVGIPSAFVLATAAVAALVLGARRAAIGWALVASLGPIGVAAEGSLTTGRGVLVDLGLGGATASTFALVVGLLSGGVLAIEASRRREPLLAVAAFLAGATGLATTWWSAGVSEDATIVGLAGLFLLAELVAGLLRRDAFWAPLTNALAAAGEIVATLAVWLGITTIAVTVSGVAIEDEPGTAGLGWALAVIALGWLLADYRRREDDATSLPIALLAGSGWSPTTVAAPVCLVGSVAILGGPLLAALTLGAIAGLLVVSGRPLAHLVATVFAIAAPAAAVSELALVGTLAGLGSLTIVWATHLRVDALAAHNEHLATLPDPPLPPPPTSASGSPWVFAAAAPPPPAGSSPWTAGTVMSTPPRRAPSRSTAYDTTIDEVSAVWLLAIASCLPVLVGIMAIGSDVALFPLLVGTVLAGWGLGALLDTADRCPQTRGAGFIPRAASLLVLPAAFTLPAGDGAVVAAALVAVAALESWRRRDPLIALTLVIAGPAALALAGEAMGFTTAETGLLLVSVAAATSVAGSLLPETWRLSAYATAASLVIVGGSMTLTDPAATATATIIAGATALGVGVLRGLTPIAWAGAVAVVLGIEEHLALAEVQVSEPFLAPVCALLLAAGIVARRQNEDISSWVAYGPAIALLGGAAVLERVAGGSIGHALVAGLVGVSAVAIGGWRLLAAPLFLGTITLVGIAGYESLVVTASIPTWMWLAAGGVLLLVTGVLMERHDTGPVEGGRRLVEVIGERFE